MSIESSNNPGGVVTVGGAYLAMGSNQAVAVSPGGAGLNRGDAMTCRSVHKLSDVSMPMPCYSAAEPYQPLHPQTCCSCKTPPAHLQTSMFDARETGLLSQDKGIVCKGTQNAIAGINDGYGE